MTVTVANLLMGPAELFIGEVIDADPAYADDDLTATFRDLGGTDGGATATVAQTYTPMTVDQIAMPVGARKTELAIQVATSLAEPTLDNLRTALNQASSATQRVEVDPHIVNAEPNYSKVILKGLQPGGSGDPRLIVLRRCLSTESIGMSWTKDGKTMIPVTFTGYYVSSSILPVEVVDEINPVP